MARIFRRHRRDMGGRYPLGACAERDGAVAITVGLLAFTGGNLY